MLLVFPGALHDEIRDQREEAIAPFLIDTQKDQKREKRKNIYRHFTHSIEKFIKNTACCQSQVLQKQQLFISLSAA